MGSSGSRGCFTSGCTCKPCRPVTCSARLPLTSTGKLTCRSTAGQFVYILPLFTGCLCFILDLAVQSRLWPANCAGHSAQPPGTLEFSWPEHGRWPARYRRRQWRYCWQQAGASVSVSVNVSRCHEQFAQLPSDNDKLSNNRRQPAPFETAPAGRPTAAAADKCQCQRQSWHWLWQWRRDKDWE